MDRNNDRPERFPDLRRKAEAAVAAEAEPEKELDPAEAGKLIHDLRVHQVELEMQNEELRSMQQALEVSRDRFSHLYNQAPVGYMTVDEAGIIFEANETLATLLHSELSELRHRPFSDFIDPRHRDVFFARFRAFFKKPAGKSMELRLRRKDGSGFYAKMEGRRGDPSLPPRGEEARRGETLLVIVSDITERKQVENTIVRAKKQWEGTFDAVSDLIAIIDEKSRIVRVNRAMAAKLDLKPEDCIGRKCYELLHRLEEPPENCPHRRFMKTGNTERQDIEEPRLGGHFIVTTAPFAGEEQHRNLCVHIAHDITERKQAEGALQFRLEIESLVSRIAGRFINLDSGGIDAEIKRSLGKVAQFINADHGFVCRLRSKDRIRPTHFWSRAGIPDRNQPLRTLRLSPWFLDRIGEHRTIQIRRPQDLPAAAADFRRNLEQLEIQSLVILPLDDASADPGFVGFSTEHQPRSWSQDVVDLLAFLGVIFTNALQRKHTLETLNKYERMVTSSQDFMALIDVDHRIQAINRNFLKIYGKDEVQVVGRRMETLVGSETYEQNLRSQFDRCLEGRELHRKTWYEIPELGRRFIHEAFYPIPREDGDADQRTAAAAMVFIGRDITRMKSLEDQLFQAQKMEAIGTLAGGIAHDFNNLLMGIQGRASLMLQDLEKNHPFYEQIKNIEAYVGSAANLTSQLLGFARGGKYEVRISDMNQLIADQIRMFGRTKKEIAIQTHYATGLWPVAVDPGQMHQVLLNLFVNAWQAMPRGGKLFIETRNVRLDERHQRPYQVQYGRYVRISVADTGVGMDEAVQRRVFEPFFTTRQMGRGTGLGLASVYGIIKNHEGYIDVESQKGRGSRFTIYLPASESKTAPQQIRREALKTGSENVLLVDDEAMILDVGTRMLEHLGYRVFPAASGREAIRVFEAKRGRIDLVILDMIMPDLSGEETYARLKSLEPGVKVLLASGYSLDDQASEILKQGCSGFIQKPFNLEELSEKVRSVLQSSGPISPV